MKTTIFYGLFFTLVALGAQTSNLQLFYQYSHQQIKEKPNSIKTYTTFLYNSDSISFYMGYNKYKIDSIFYVSAESNTGLANFDAQAFVDKISMYNKKSLREYRINWQDSLLTRFLELGRDLYFVQEKLPTLNWQLAKGDSVIAGYTCKKALLKNFRGRDYVAWYTPEIPISRGPFLFHGLPGLIAHIADTKKHHTFQLQGIKPVPKYPEAFQYSIYKEKTQLQNLTELKSTQKNYVMAAAQRARSRSHSFTINGEPEDKIKRELKIKNRIKRFLAKNNPIELNLD